MLPPSASTADTAGLTPCPRQLGRAPGEPEPGQRLRALAGAAPGWPLLGRPSSHVPSPAVGQVSLHSCLESSVPLALAGGLPCASDASAPALDNCERGHRGRRSASLSPPPPSLALYPPPSHSGGGSGGGSSSGGACGPPGGLPSKKRGRSPHPRWALPLLEAASSGSGQLRALSCNRRLRRPAAGATSWETSREGVLDAAACDQNAIEGAALQIRWCIPKLGRAAADPEPSKPAALSQWGICVHRRRKNSQGA